MDDEPQIMLGGIPLTAPTVKDAKLNIFLWGDSGAGKTTLAATAPGRKLLLLTDPTGDMSLTNRGDVEVVRLTHETPNRMMSQFRSVDPYGIDKFLGQHPEYETVIMDSVTTLAYMALQEAVQRAGGDSKLEQPGMHGYAFRNASLLRIMVVLLQLCAKHGRHFIAITHEGSDIRDKAGNVLSISTILSPNSENSIGQRFNEIWWMADNGTDRTIAVRPCRTRKPMKTRIFEDKPEFVWHYNANTHEGEGIADWYRQWQEGGGNKIPLPSRPVPTVRGGAKR